MTVKRVILRGTKDLSTQANAATIAIANYPDAKPGTVVGIKTYGRFFGVRWNRGSLTVYPQTTNADDAE